MSAVVSKKGISLEGAQAVVAAALAAAKEIEGGFSVVVVDEGGALKALARTDGAGVASIQAATDKAYTTVATGLTPKQWDEYSAGDPHMAAGAAGMERLIMFDGGYPLQVDGEVVGAIGVSGGHYEQDAQIAQAGVLALAS
jgi:uncharacterized protein GlcG (DUF336 family)